jgi:tetratricopeptide (TPR) repeat protein
MPRPSVFASGTTDDYEELRQRLANKLRLAGVDVPHQESNLENGRPTLTKVDENLCDCVAVVQIVGPSFGAVAGQKVVDDLLERLDHDKFLARGSLHSLRKVVLDSNNKYTHSYTQWEAILAKHHDIPLLVYCPNDVTAFDPRQTEHLKRLAGVSAHAKPFADEAELWELILKDLVGVLASNYPGAAKLLESPPPCHLPYLPLGELFVGRKAFLDDLRAQYDAAKAKGGTLPNHAIFGLGGVGKTRAVVEYAWQHRDAYSGVFFVTGESANAFHRDLANLADELSDTNVSTASDPDRLAATFQWLTDHPGWLLIIDNVDDEAAKVALIKQLSRLAFGHVLITGRVTIWPNDVIRLELHVLDPKAAADFLLRATPGRWADANDDRLAAELANDVLGSLCLPLTQAAAYIDDMGIGFAEYTPRWIENQKDVRGWGENSLLHYHDDKDVAVTTATTWLTSFEQLTPAGRGLLEMLAWLDPAPLPRGLLTSAAVESELRTLLGDAAADAEEAVADLRRFSFLSRAAPGENFDPQIHRVVQLISRDRQSHDKQALIAALRAINSSFVGAPMDVRSWPTLDPLAPHAATVTGFADAARITDPTSRLMNQLGTLYFTKALHEQAEPMMRRALAIDEASFGKDHPEVAIRLNNLAQLLKATNRLAEAEPLMQRVVEIFEKSLGENHPNVATALNNLAMLLQDTNRLAETEPLLRRALSIDETSFGKDHPEVATDLNNLATLLQATNRLAEAEPLMRRALAIDEASFGKDHPNVAIRLNNLAQLLKATNRLAEAEPLMRRALAIDEASFGKDHPKVATDLNNLAALLQATNRLAEAEPLMQRVVEILEKSHGENHPNVATALNNLAQLLKATNRLAEAEPLMRRALAIDEASFGKDHPKVAIRLNNLAQLLKVTNRLAEAEPLMQRVVEIFEKSLGENHPNVATALNNLATLLQNTNRLAEAEPLMARVVAIFALFGRNTGHQHPHMQAAIGNYRGLLLDMKLPAEEIEQRIQSAQEPVKP